MNEVMKKSRKSTKVEAVAEKAKVSSWTTGVCGGI
jgi:hypothetical protein